MVNIEPSMESRRILLYARKHDPDGERLLEMIAGLPLEGGLRYSRSFPELVEGLRSPGAAENIVVLMASDLEELYKLIKLKEMYGDVPILLVLPDLDETVVREAHLLAPRFLCRKDGNFENLAKVLEKMLSHPEPRMPPQSHDSPDKLGGHRHGRIEEREVTK